MQEIALPDRLDDQRVLGGVRGRPGTRGRESPVQGVAAGVDDVG
jgi:hypothetical protein